MWRPTRVSSFPTFAPALAVVCEAASGYWCCSEGIKAHLISSLRKVGWNLDLSFLGVAHRLRFTSKIRIGHNFL